MSPNRIVLDSPIGSIQAWPERSTEPSVVVILYAGVSHAPTKTAYLSQSLNLRSSEARRLAGTLIEAADHADKVCTDVSAPPSLGDAA